VSISGNLSDIAVVDLLQFVHMSQRSGTLLLESGRRSAHISFHRGRIASAWSPASLSVVKHLIDRKIITPDEVAWVERQRKACVPVPSLGQALLDAGVVTKLELRDAVATKIEHTILDLVGWQRGTFRLLADEVRTDDELTFAPGDVLPDLDIDTQGILLEAVRVFDERNRAGAPVARASSQPPSLPPIHLAPPELSGVPSRAGKGLRVQVVSKDPSLAELLANGLGGAAAVSEVELRDAGAPHPGEASPLVVVDRRGTDNDQGALKRIRDLHPRSVAVALVGSPTEIGAAFADGAAAVAELSYLSACCANLLRARHATQDDGSELGLRSGLGRLRRVLGDLRSGLLSATVSLNLMTIVADSVERAVLFVQQRDALVALGAFGTTNDGRSLAATTRGVALRLDATNAIVRSIMEGHALTLDYDGGELPPELNEVVDRPRSGQGVFFPVLGARRAIGLIYADNGRRASGIQDVELMELATAQVGLAFENELLRRQLDRVGADQKN
jgi:hypothetical protein